MGGVHRSPDAIDASPKPGVTRTVSGPVPPLHGHPPGKKVRRIPNGTTLLSNERTFLAQTRTGIALMAFGFVVARFAIFLAGMRSGRAGSAGLSGGHSLDRITGAAITALGALVVLLAAVRYVKRLKQIRKGRLVTSPALDLALAGAVTLAGVGLAVYLIAAL